MPLTSFFRLIRWKNLVFLFVILLLIKYVLFEFTDADTFLNSLYFSILAFSVLSIAAAGYLLNDIHDVEADLINKPLKVLVGKTVQEEEALFVYNLLNVIGLLAGFAISFLIHKVSFSLVFVITSLLLYKYSNILKYRFLTGNLSISFLAFLSVLILGVFDLVPATDTGNRAEQLHVFTIVFNIGIFAFLLTFIREIVKDIEDIPGDRKVGAQTFPIKMGIAKTKQLVIGLSILSMVLVILYAYMYFSATWYALLYISLLVLAPLAYFIFKLKFAKAKKEFDFLSSLLKGIMFTGILTVFLF